MPNIKSMKKNIVKIVKYILLILDRVKRKLYNTNDKNLYKNRKA